MHVNYASRYSSSSIFSSTTNLILTFLVVLVREARKKDLFSFLKVVIISLVPFFDSQNLSATPLYKFKTTTLHFVVNSQNAFFRYFIISTWYQNTIV